jgi:xylulokinase
VSEGVVVVSLGTSGTIFTHSDRPIVDPEGLIAPFCASVGGWLPLLCVMNLTAVAGEVAEGFEVGHAELTKRAQQVPVGCDGLLWLPFLSGERVPDLPDASGTLLGMRAGHLRPGVLYRAALEGTSLNLGAGLDRLRALGIDVDEVRAVGGAAGNPLWRQILADVFGCPVAATAQTESAALGAAIQALWTQRRIDGEDVSAAEVASPFVKLDGEPTQPDGPSHAAYQQLLERFNTAVQAVYRGGACSQTLHG